MKHILLISVFSIILTEQLYAELIDGPANIRTQANGKLIDQLPDLHPVTLLKIEGK